MTNRAGQLASLGIPIQTRGLLLAFIAASAIVACASGGPGVEGPQARALFAEYSGTWVLDTLVSDPVPELPDLVGPGGEDGPFGGGGPAGGGLRPGGGGPPGGGAGVGGGGRAGMGPPGGRMGGRGGGMGGIARRDMEAVRRLTSFARHRPERITLMIDDSVFAVAPSSGIRVEVPTGGEDVEVRAASWPIRAKVQWSDLQPSLERNIEGAGRIVDHFEVIDGARLILTRTVEMGRGRGLQLVFAYDRESG